MTMDSLNAALDDDSDDLTAEEAEKATVVQGPVEFNQQVAEWVKAIKGLNQKRRYELRRRKPHMYCRVAIGDGPDRVSKLFRVDWFK